MYTQHPNQMLTELFADKPYQGVSPHEAKFLFVGLDANYGDDIAENIIFPKILNYHRDATAFWTSHGIHHPFLLSGYRGAGLNYHRNFAKIGFTPQEAHKVSFLEMLHVATVGRNLLTTSDLNSQHLRFVRSAIFDGTSKHVFLSQSVLRLMQLSGLFNELQPTLRSLATPLPVIYRSKNVTIYKHLHFSVYGRFEAMRIAQAQAISSLRTGG